MRENGVIRPPYAPHIKMLTTDPPILITDPDHPSQPHICTRSESSASAVLETQRLEMMLIDDLAEVAHNANIKGRVGIYRLVPVGIQ